MYYDDDDDDDDDDEMMRHQWLEAVPSSLTWASISQDVLNIAWYMEKEGMYEGERTSL